jgi:hypothetical protein
VQLYSINLGPIGAGASTAGLYLSNPRWRRHSFSAFAFLTVGPIVEIASAFSGRGPRGTAQCARTAWPLEFATIEGAPIDSMSGRSITRPEQS